MVQEVLTHPSVLISAAALGVMITAAAVLIVRKHRR